MKSPYGNSATHALRRLKRDRADLAERVVERRLWQSRLDRDGVPFTSFEAFVTARLVEGLETTVDDLLIYCRKKPDVQALIWGEIGEARPQGRPKKDEGKGDDVTFSRGNSATHALRRLKRDRADLAERVVKGELSPHAAMIEAGFRHRQTG